MAILSNPGNTYSSGDPVTAANLNAQITGAVFEDGAGEATDGTTLEVHSSGYLKIKDGGVDTAQLAAGAVTSDKLATSAITTLMPSGAVIPYAGTSTPTKWLLCAGQAVSRTTYADLFSAISTTYGVGDGSTTFNLPDLRGRVAAGKDDMGGSGANRLTSGSAAALDGDTLGTGGGSEEHALTEAQMPKHYHQMRGPNAITAPQNDGGSSGHGNYGGGTPDDAAQEYGTYSTGGGSASGTQSTGTANGNAHTNVQPTLVLNYIIKT